MKCDVCGTEVANSEELKAHMEREHTLEERSDEELESPNFAEDKEEQPAPVRGQG